MSQANARSQERSGRPGETENTRQQSPARKLAEWVTMGISMLLILGLAGYLVFQGFQPAPPYIPAEVRALMQQVRQDGERYILPVEVANRGNRTLRDLKVEVTYLGPEGKETQDFLIDYLGERSQQNLFFYFDRHPAELQVETQPVSYRLD